MTVTYNRHRDCWVYDFIRSGKRYQGVCTDARSRTQAEKIERGIVATVEKALADGRGTRPPAVMNFSLSQAIEENLTITAAEKKYIANKVTYMRVILDFFGIHRTLDDIDEDDIEEFIAFLIKGGIQHYVGGPKKGGSVVVSNRRRSAETINNYLDFLESSWTRAYNRHRRRNPAFMPPPEIRRLDVSKPLPTPIAPENVGTILGKIDKNIIHLLYVIVLSVHTGMRLREVLELTWSEVDLDRQIIALTDRTKSRVGRVVDLSSTAVAVLKHLQEQRTDKFDRVILYRKGGSGKPRAISSVKSAWKRLMKDADLASHHTFHDLRAAYGTYLAEQQTDPFLLQQMIGHADIRTTQRHYILVRSERRRAAAMTLDQHPGTQEALKAMNALAPVYDAETRRAEARKYVGVYPAGKSRFEAKITITGDAGKKMTYLGCFDTAEQAARAYDDAARPLGRRTNFTSDSEFHEP